MKIIERETMSERIRRVLDLTDPKRFLSKTDEEEMERCWRAAVLADAEREARDSKSVDRTLTLSAAHRLLGQLAETTNSRSELEECRDVMAKLERMVADA